MATPATPPSVRSGPASAEPRARPTAGASAGPVRGYGASMGAAAALWDALVQIGTMRSYRAGSLVMRRNSDQHSVVAVVDGLCKVTDVDRDGHEVLVAVRGRGDVFGEIAALTGGTRTASVEALVDVRAATVTVDEFNHFLDDARNVRLLATMLAERVAENNRPAMSAHRKVDARLADRILLLAERFGVSADGRVEVRTPLTHDDLASWVGATRAVTTRAMGSLRDRQYIDFGRGWLHVLDREGLRKLCLLE